MQFTNEEIINNKIRKYKRMKIISIIIFLLLMPLILCAIFLIVQSLIKPTKIPEVYGIKTFIMQENYNEFNIGDIILTKKIDGNNIKIDDIIFYRKNNNIFEGKVIDINNNNFIVKDKDNNNFSVKYEEIEGIYYYKFLSLGNIAIFLQNNIILISTLLIFYLLYFYKTTEKKKSFIRKKKRERFEYNFRTKMDNI